MIHHDVDVINDRNVMISNNAAVAANGRVSAGASEAIVSVDLWQRRLDDCSSGADHQREFCHINHCVNL